VEHFAIGEEVAEQSQRQFAGEIRVVQAIHFRGAGDAEVLLEGNEREDFYGALG
jgi:hypothetical protein